MDDGVATFNHPAFRSGIGVAVGYGLILAVLLVAIYLAPFAIFRAV